MSNGIHFSLATLPERYRAQVARQLLSSKPVCNGKLEAENECKECNSRRNAGKPGDEGVQGVEHPGDSEKKRGRNGKCNGKETGKAKQVGPNATESKFNRDVLGGTGMYEAVTFQFAKSCRYTPDWVVFDRDTGRMTCYEVKGAYAFHSQNRARIAFLTCREKFPQVTFRWFRMDRAGCFEELYVDRS